MLKSRKSEQLTGALPNGSLENGTIKLFEDSGFPILRKPRQHDVLVANSIVSSVTFMRPQHIAKLVENGTYDFGICGTDCIEEAEADVVSLAELEYGRGNSSGRTKIVLIAEEKKELRVDNIPRDSQVLTEYPYITRRSFKEWNIPVQLQFSYGGTEAHIPRDYLLGVCLSDSGESLKANHKQVVSILLHSCTTLVANRRVWKEKRNLLTALKHCLVGTLDAQNSVFVVMNVPARKKEWTLRQLPALKKPTVARLADRNYFSVGTVVKKRDIASLMPRLLRNGVDGWVETPITRVVQKW